MAYNHKRKQKKINAQDKQHLIVMIYDYLIFFIVILIKNDLINMKYSKMMTIIENTKVKLDKEDQFKITTDFFISSDIKKNRYLVLKKKLNELQQRKISSQITKSPQKAFIMPVKDPFRSPIVMSRDSSFLLINSSSFEIDNQALKERSLSMYLKDNKELDRPDGGSFAMSQNQIQSFRGLSPSEKDLIEEPLNEDEDKKRVFGKKNELLKKKKKNDRPPENIVVNKRFMYYDDEGNNFCFFSNI